ncbi:MAG: hypothetical protein L6R30_16980 [Thermoanaerobaculia bacterium]|nr:hypothetical protein [Thermoanaerobaculia bacterium]
MPAISQTTSLKGTLVRLLARNRNDQARVRHLVRVALKALDIRPRNYPWSIFGPEETWLHPTSPFSEFTLLDPRRPGRALQYVLDTSIPSLPIEAPAFLPEFVETLFFHPTRIIRWGKTNSGFPDEAWFFINGIMTNPDIAKLNARCLGHLFGRPLTIIQNSTNGLLVDLVQCAIGKEWDVMTEPVLHALPAILEALRDPKKSKVVVIAHSQGTIITGDVLDVLKDHVNKVPRPMWSSATARYDDAVGAFQARQKDAGAAHRPRKALSQGLTPFESLPPLALDQLAKLEIYAFANCSSRMTRHPRGIPLIESFGNSKDIVARLGMFSGDTAIKIDGPKWERKQAWGHLLNEHYLVPMIQAVESEAPGPASGAAPFVPYRPGPEHPDRPLLYRYVAGRSASNRARRGSVKAPGRRSSQP